MPTNNSLVRRIAALERGRPLRLSPSGRDLAVWMKLPRADYAGIFGEGATEATRAALWHTYAARFLPRDLERDGPAPWPFYALDAIRPNDRVYWHIDCYTPEVADRMNDWWQTRSALPSGARVADVTGYDMAQAEAQRRGSYWHFVDVRFWGEGDQEWCGIPCRQTSWAVPWPASGSLPRLPLPIGGQPAPERRRVGIRRASGARG